MKDIISEQRPMTKPLATFLWHFCWGSIKTSLHTNCGVLGLAFKKASTEAKRKHHGRSEQEGRRKRRYKSYGPFPKGTQVILVRVFFVQVLEYMFVRCQEKGGWEDRICTPIIIHITSYHDHLLTEVLEERDLQLIIPLYCVDIHTRYQ